MKLSDAKRRYLADALAKVAEYLISITILGQLVSEKVHVWVLIWAGVLFVSLILFGVWVIPDDEGECGR